MVFPLELLLFDEADIDIDIECGDVSDDLGELLESQVIEDIEIVGVDNSSDIGEVIQQSGEILGESTGNDALLCQYSLLLAIDELDVSKDSESYERIEDGVRDVLLFFPVTPDVLFCSGSALMYGERLMDFVLYDDAGVIFSQREKSLVRVALPTVQQQNRLNYIRYWGKIEGIANDYYILTGWDEYLGQKKFFYSTDCEEWALMPDADPQVENIVKYEQSRF
ncbi:MAG: hypothetical protein EZS28_043920, partial [Streblomastix strix]